MAQAEGGLKITLVKSAIGYTKRQKETVRALGLRSMHQTVIRPNNPQMRGMVFAVQHLLQWEEVDTAPEPAKPKPQSKKQRERAAAVAAATTDAEGRAE